MDNFKNLRENIRIEEIFPPILAKIHSMTVQQMIEYQDPKGWKLQHIAAKWGHFEAVKTLIKVASDFQEKIDGKTASELAFEQRHFNIVLTLLQANYPFPANYDSKIAYAGLKAFADLSENLHACINDGDSERVKEILNENSNLKYFYDTQNRSAVRCALESGNFEIYELLVSHHLILGKYEEFDKIICRFGDLNCRDLREIHLKLAPSIFAEPMALLFKNSHFGPNCKQGQEQRNFVSEAYSYLFQNVKLKSVLNAVAASNTFKIVYDFSNESVYYLDPTADRSTDGIFYFSGRIFVAAKSMLEPGKKFEIFGVIAHELTHYAMFLTYNNFAYPYFKKDVERKQELNLIVEELQNLRGYEMLIDSVFDFYHKELWDAELIVRVPQMMALYHDRPDILAEKREVFFRLFKYYEEFCVPDMERALPKITKKFRCKKDKKNKRRKKNLWTVSSILVLILIIGIPTAIMMWLKSYSWLNLTIDQKSMIRNHFVNFFNCEVKFREIFSETSDVYYQLGYKEILGVLWGSPFEFQSTINEERENYVRLNASHLPGNCLREKFLTSNVLFQGKTLKILELLSNNSNAFKYLESLQVIRILKGEKSLEISKKLKSKLNFYVERDFVQLKCPNSSCTRLDFATVLQHISHLKLFILSSDPGEGKSIAFRYFALKMKEQWPSKWIEFVDLKQNIKVFETTNKIELSSLGDIQNFLSTSLLNLSTFEKAIFMEKFQKGDVIFFWDGIDETSAVSTNFIFELIVKLNNLTLNWQLASTRHKFLSNFQRKSNISIFKLLPASPKKIFEYLIKFIIKDELELDVDDFFNVIGPHLNISLTTKQIVAKMNDSKNERVKFYLNKIDFVEFLKTLNDSFSVLKSIKASIGNVSPILIEMAVEAGKNENFQITKNFNSFLLYEIFLQKKIEIALNKNKNFTKNDLINALELRGVFTYSFLLERYFGDKKYKSYVEGKISQNFKSSEIAMNMIFKHHTFSDFFAARYLINNLILNFTPSNDLETEIELFLINQIFYGDGFDILQKFVLDFLNINTNSFTKHWHNHNEKINQLQNVSNLNTITDLLSFVDLSYYFVKNHNVSKNLITNNFDSFDWDLDEFRILLFNWDAFVKILGEDEIRFALEIRNEHGSNLLYHFCDAKENGKTEILPQLLNLYSQNFDNETLRGIFMNPKDNENLIMDAVKKQNKEFIEYLWDFTQNIFQNDDELREVLIMENLLEKRTILDIAKYNKDKRLIPFLKTFVYPRFYIDF